MSSTIFSKNNHGIYDETIKSLAAYFVDVIGESGLPSDEQIALGMDRIYRPIPEFWLHFSSEMVFNALSIACPDWERSAKASSPTDLFSLSSHISLELVDRILHEALAEDFLSVQSARRPVSKTDVFTWICSHLRKARKSMVLKIIKAEGPRAADKVLQFVRLREAAL